MVPRFSQARLISEPLARPVVIGALPPLRKAFILCEHEPRVIVAFFGFALTFFCEILFRAGEIVRGQH
jgi:hypothetical protein